MAINITQSPNNIHPAYNDSYLKFTSTYTVDDRAVVVLDSLYQFTLFPDENGEYLFNMKEVIKALINDSQFKDTIDSSVAGWGFNDASLYKEITVDIIVYGDGANETVSNTYTFNKAVKQYGDTELTNPHQLMLPSKDGINYHLTYFEGFPIDLPFRFLAATTTIALKNRRTTDTTQNFTSTVAAPYRLFLDKGNTNLAIEDILKLSDSINNIDIIINGVVASTVELKKAKNQCGRYIKWFNADGSYSYWLFNQWYKQEYVGKEIDRVSTNSFNDIYNNQEGINKITGKNGGSSLKLKTLVTEDEKNHLISLVTSPMVQMWSESDPYQDGRWIDVKLVSNGFNYANKKSKNQVEVDIELPEVNTQIL